MKLPSLQDFVGWVVMFFAGHLGWILFDPVVRVLSGLFAAGMKAAGNQAGG